MYVVNEEHAGFNCIATCILYILYWEKIKSPCLIESTAAAIDGSSDVQAGKVVLTQGPWQNSLVSLSNSVGSLAFEICDCKLEMIMNVKF